MSLFSTVHRSGWVLVDPDTIIENGYVKTEFGSIADVGKGRAYGPSDQVIDHGPGLLMPGLVNAHTHLELCALKNNTDFYSGFIPWVQSVIRKREQAGEEHLKKGIVSGVNELIRTGTMVVGEISSTGISRQTFLNSKLSGILFREYLGAAASDTFEIKNVSFDKKISLAGHAPHTTATDLLIQLKTATDQQNLPFSLHLAESLEEIEFLQTGKGPWADFLEERHLDSTVIKRTGSGPVVYANNAGLLNDKTLAVHLVFADRDDIQLLAGKKVHVCLCLRSNLQLHGELPDVPAMINAGLNLCLGTDSSASTDSLSIFDEMRFFSASFPEISPADIIAMASINGASALGCQDRHGRLLTGMSSKMIYVPVINSTVEGIRESVVATDFSGKIKPIFE